jgi:HD-like signal output (HDOD) protein
MSPAAEYFKDLTLPTIPEVAHELIRSLNEDEVPLLHLKEAIARDPSLAVQLLRLANSALYGTARPVGTVDEAVSRVGTNQVRALALAAFFNDAFPIAPGLEREAFWRASQTHGGLSQWLANGIGSEREHAWLTGFMVRLGELIMGLKTPGCVIEFEKLPMAPGERWKREAAMMGFTEGQVSAELARCWNFPEDMIQALDASADPMAAQPFSRLGAMLHVAELLAASGLDNARAVDELPSEVLAALDLNTDWFHERLPEVKKMMGSQRLH